jgi:hypothetical protein
MHPSRLKEAPREVQPAASHAYAGKEIVREEENPPALMHPCRRERGQPHVRCIKLAAPQAQAASTFACAAPVGVGGRRGSWKCQRV